MEYILRKTTINTVEIRAEIDEDQMTGKTPEQIRDELNTLGYLHGWKNPVESHQTVLIEIGEDTGVGSTRIGNWTE